MAKGMTAGESRRLVIKGRIGGSGNNGSDKGAAAGKEVSVHARLHAEDRRLYQLTIVGMSDTLAESDRDMFFSWFERR